MLLSLTSVVEALCIILFVLHDLSDLILKPLVFKIVYIVTIYTT